MSFRSRMIVLLLAATSISAVHADEVDPCKNITGQWSGILKEQRCVMDATAKFYRYHSTIRMNLHLEEKSKRECSTTQFDWVFSGTCKKALIDLGDFKGSIFDDSVYLKIAQNGSTLNLDRNTQ